MNTNPKAKEILTELKREMAMRRRVYPRWVTEGRMTQEQMAQRMRCVQAAIDVFEDRAKAEAEQKDLF